MSGGEIFAIFVMFMILAAKLFLSPVRNADTRGERIKGQGSRKH